MLTKAILGIALLVGGAIPVWSAYIPVKAVLGDSGYYPNAILMRDGDLNSFGDGYIQFGGVAHPLHATLPVGYSVAAIKLDFKPTASGPWRLSFNFADSSVSYCTFTATPTVLNTQFCSSYEGYVNKPYAQPESLTIEYQGAEAYAYLYIYEWSTFTPADEYSTIITSDTIGSLLQNATFQTTITSVAAVSNIADFLTFAPNSDGGKAAFLFGCVLAFAFIVGIKATA